MHSYVRPNQHIALRLPSGFTKLAQVVPNTAISLGKFGNFPTNQIIGRPFYVTYDIETPDEKDGSCLRVVSAAELHAESLLTEGKADGEEPDTNPDGTPMRTNRETVDDASTQKLTFEEIETLKKASGGSGRELIAKILDSHSSLDQKTAFSLAKYTLRKRMKFLQRFTVLPLDVSLLTNHLLQERDAARVMELRDESIGLVGCWGNVHHGGNTSLDDVVSGRNGRYLVVDDTGGLMVAAMAERMGILYPHDGEDHEEAETAEQSTATGIAQGAPSSRPPRRTPMSASGNSITLLHTHKQPNLTLLKYFGFNQDNSSETHPLYTNLKTVSWLQLLEPNEDIQYTDEPAIIPDGELALLKTSKRSQYHRKRTRWTRVQSVVNEARAGDFDGLIVATQMDPETVLNHTVPLLKGSASIAVYSPSVESLTELMDLYSAPSKTAYMNRRNELREQRQQESKDDAEDGDDDYPELKDEFPLNPTLLLASALETSRVRSWQVLPGRTHPLMSGRGGAEGYIFHAVRAHPTRKEISAAGNPSRKRRKVAETTSTPTADSSGVDVEMKS
ncbi:tRNA (adenine(58)-N(1))-methyltransferase non-catalytic subunit trm6 [Aspergillus nanangensis]|uniref:tRNA (adenine(58)-N(1))-methyltransferase non-catalytic subunit TRM6 n=1 Tax=Aspergillus nanangensis TaxID=2582783 RepID=A0AAD4CEA8_ASPNN|nr:tRNA (adenine(58)-N(1))-methyltransferase non-catalytic subunit trm6 [Aspergillus nanangensis]